jgi:hypothetical protein
MGVAKVENIAGGTMEACRMVIQRTGMRQMADDLRMPRRIIHETLGVPVPAQGSPEKRGDLNEESLLKVLAEDYRVNPGLHMSRDDLKLFFDVPDDRLDQVLVDLERKGLVRLLRDKKGIALAKATYEGLGRAYPDEHYRWFPGWVKQENIF